MRMVSLLFIQPLMNQKGVAGYEVSCRGLKADEARGKGSIETAEFTGGEINFLNKRDGYDRFRAIVGLCRHTYYKKKSWNTLLISIHKKNRCKLSSFSSACNFSCITISL